MVVATVVFFLVNTALSTMLTIAWARGSERVIPQFAFFFSTVGRLLGRAAGVRLLGLALLRHLPLRLGPPAPLADRAPGLHLHRGAVRDRQAALRPVPRPLRLGRSRRRATPTSARRCCSSCGSTTRPSSSCSAAWSPRPGSCGRCSSGSAPSSAERRGGRLPRARRAHAPFHRSVGVLASWPLAVLPPAARRARPRTAPRRQPARGGGPRGHPGHRLRVRRRGGRGRSRRASRRSTSPDARAAAAQRAPVEGRDAIQQFWGGPARTRTSCGSMIARGRDRRARATWPYARGHYMLDGTPKATGTPPLHDQGKFLEVLRRQPDGSWRYAVDMYSSEPAGARGQVEFPSPGPRVYIAGASGPKGAGA